MAFQMETALIGTFSFPRTNLGISDMKYTPSVGLCIGSGRGLPGPRVWRVWRVWRVCGTAAPFAAVKCSQQAAVGLPSAYPSVRAIPAPSCQSPPNLRPHFLFHKFRT